ncbi:thioredoxin-disulfide reductase [Chloroflexota bacterium]
MDQYDVIIIGGGPGGLTAGIYASRAGLKSLLIEKEMFGGQIVKTTSLDNYPGFPDGIAGYDLIDLMLKQTEKYGLETKLAEVTALKPGDIHEVTTSEGPLAAKSVIIAAGADYVKMGMEKEEAMVGRGISYCATCDGFFFANRKVAVIGGGDTAITDALELAKHASVVNIIHRRDQLRADPSLQKKAFDDPKINFVWDSVVADILGDNMVSGLKLRNVKTDQLSDLEVDGVFVAIGVKPNSQHFTGVIDIDEAGYIVVDQLMTTSVPGIYAIGDIRKNSSRQVATAVGDGATAAINAFKYIQEKG